MKLPVLVAFSMLAATAQIRVGIIGTDTSHVPAFTQMMNDPTAKNYIPGVHVVAAHKGGSPDIEHSISRVDQYANEIATKYGVEIVATIPELLKKVDVVMLESVDGRPHLEQVRPVIAAHKPVFIDKPLAASYDDAIEIARLANEAHVPWFSASSLRWSEITETMKFDDARSVFTWGPGPLEEHHEKLDLSWYAIHPIEVLYTLLGPGCEEVSRIETADGDLITGKWKGGRTGAVQTLRPYGPYGAVVFRSGGKVVESPSKPHTGYEELVKQIVKFFETKQPPVANSETLEIFAFMDAAERSQKAGGVPVKLRIVRVDAR
ncbi:MAG TPA: Gfo/Idh/MocA family oxidoreductase [Bryobacteraceae bacterium]|jgi:hypothetical protein